jgi:hypothetical protein
VTLFFGSETERRRSLSAQDAQMAVTEEDEEERIRRESYGLASPRVALGSDPQATSRSLAAAYALLRGKANPSHSRYVPTTCGATRRLFHRRAP